MDGLDGNSHSSRWAVRPTRFAGCGWLASGLPLVTFFLEKLFLNHGPELQHSMVKPQPPISLALQATTGCCLFTRSYASVSSATSATRNGKVSNLKYGPAVVGPPEGCVGEMLEIYAPVFCFR